MKIILDLPDYDDEVGVDVFWREGSRIKVDLGDEEVCIFGNAEALRSLGEQMIYLSQKQVPNYSHVHFDEFFCGDSIKGLKFCIGKDETV